MALPTSTITINNVEMGGNNAGLADVTGTLKFNQGRIAGNQTSSSLCACSLQVRDGLLELNNVTVLNNANEGGHAIFRDHKVSPALWAAMEKHFGRQGAVEVTMIMADYAMAGFILTAVDQQLPPERKPLLPQR